MLNLCCFISYKLNSLITNELSIKDIEIKIKSYH